MLNEDLFAHMLNEDLFASISRRRVIIFDSHETRHRKQVEYRIAPGNRKREASRLHSGRSTQTLGTTAKLGPIPSVQVVLRLGCASKPAGSRFANDSEVF